VANLASSEPRQQRTSPAANLASSENHRHARLQKEWTTFERPGAGGGKIGSGEDEALFISIYFGRQPLGVRTGADHEDESAPHGDEGGVLRSTGRFRSSREPLPGENQRNFGTRRRQLI
jgi:hypothetical protein